MTTRGPSTADPLTSMLVGDVMRREVVTCPPEATVPEMAAVMVAHGFHAAMVTPACGHQPLIVGDLELIAAALAGEQVHAQALARDPIATVTIDAPLTDAVAIMSTRSVSHLLVVAPETGAGVGVLSTLDLVAAAVGARPDAAGMPRPGPAWPLSEAHDLTQARVADLMHAGITIADVEGPISAVARIMAETRTHCTAVSGIDASPGRERRLVWGLVDDLDLVGALYRGQLDSPASTIADTTPLAVRGRDSMAAAAALMVEHERRHLVAIGPAREPAGIVSTWDVVRVLASGAGAGQP